MYINKFPFLKNLRKNNRKIYKNLRLIPGMMNKNYEFFMKANVDSYVGNWIAICDQKIISHGTSAKKVYQEAKAKYPKKRPLITRVPDKQTMIF